MIQFGDWFIDPYSSKNTKYTIIMFDYKSYRVGYYECVCIRSDGKGWDLESDVLKYIEANVSMLGLKVPPHSCWGWSLCYIEELNRKGFLHHVNDFNGYEIE